MKPSHTPPFELTAKILELVIEISEEVGRRGWSQEKALPPALRRGNRLRSIHASLAIENNSLTLDQMTALLNGKRVLGPAQDIQEVKNAFAAYEALTKWNPTREKDLLAAHHLMLQGLATDAGRWRKGAVGIAKGDQLVHLAPPASRVPGLMKELLNWLKQTDVHPLVAGCVFHYELEFIHPFSDGNGRMGRLWQTLILSRWKPSLAWLPVESVIRERQAAYYAALASADKAGQCTGFIEFLLTALLKCLREVAITDQVSDQVTDQVKALLRVLGNRTLSALECMDEMNLVHRPTFRQNYLNPALDAGLIERTLPGKPNSRMQKYRRASLG
jgi:Fic family protein